MDLGRANEQEPPAQSRFHDKAEVWRAFVTIKYRHEGEEFKQLAKNRLPWNNVPAGLERIKQRIIDGTWIGAVLISGPPRIGKTWWAEGFGIPLTITGEWIVKRFLEKPDDYTHLILKHIKWEFFPYWREVLTSRASFEADGQV
ncbi:hypothetical protein PspLS_11719 [Pyricularia sp. CBS 133598]|nr:hypothetical protein PspLS_11719 [Pyricularia sp. CBS 133598]